MFDIKIKKVGTKKREYHSWTVRKRIKNKMILVISLGPKFPEDGPQCVFIKVKRVLKRKKKGQMEKEGESGRKLKSEKRGEVVNDEWGTARETEILKSDVMSCGRS